MVAIRLQRTMILEIALIYKDLNTQKSQSQTPTIRTESGVVWVAA